MWDSSPSQRTPHSLRGAAWITSSVPAVPQHPSRGLRVGVARRGSQKHTLPSWGGVTCLWDSPPRFCNMPRKEEGRVILLDGDSWMGTAGWAGS